jgi:S-layer protein (TIGR01567 family)
MSENEKCILQKFVKNNYFYGKLMTVRDFTDEQFYGDEKRRLINRLVHGFGLVRNFSQIELKEGAEGKIKVVFADGGVALDCCGQEIVVPPQTEKEVENLNVTNIGELNYLYLRSTTCLGEKVRAASSASGCAEICCGNKIIEDFKVVADTASPDIIRCGVKGISGKATDSTGNTITLGKNASLIDAAYKNMQIEITDGSGEGQIRRIIEYNGTTKKVTVDSAWTDPIPDDTSSYEIICCPDFSSVDNNIKALERIKEWVEKVVASCPPCDRENPRVFLAATKNLKIDPVETRHYRSFVYNNKTLYELLTCHVSDFNNPHKTDAEQVKALKTVNGVGNINPDNYVPNVDLVSNDNTINITPSTDITKPNIDLVISDNSIQRKHFNNDVFSNLLTSKDNSITITPGNKQIDIRAVSGVSYKNEINGGVATFALKEGKQISDWIPSRLGPGPVCVILGLELENIVIGDEKIDQGIYIGDAQAFSPLNAIKWLPLGALVSPNSGNFKIGILLSDDMYGRFRESGLNEIKVHWWAFKHGVEQVGGDNTWTYKANVLDEDNVTVLKIHVSQIQSNNDASVVIDGIWLSDYLKAIEIEPDDEFGKLNNVSISARNIIISNDDVFTLTRDSDVEIGQGMFFKVANTLDNVFRYCPVKRITDPGTYEIRGEIATGDMKWNAVNFAGFYYNIDNDVFTESLTVSGINGRVIPTGGLKYITAIEDVDYKYYNKDAGWEKYPVIGFFAEQYIPLNSDKADKLAKLVLDSDDKYTIRTGELRNLGDGYAIGAKQVDVDGEKVWLEFTKDGEFIADEIVSVTSGSSNTWEVKLNDIQGENNVVVFRVHINQVFQGAMDSIAQIEGIWLIDYKNSITIRTDDKFGELNHVIINGATLSITNQNALTLDKDSYLEIGPEIFLKVADSDVLKYCPWKKITNSGSYDIRGQVFSGLNGSVWGSFNFAAFYYNFNDNASTETLNVSGIIDGGIPPGGLVYATQISKVHYKFKDWGTYPVIGFFGDGYIPINDASKLTKLLLDSNDKRTLGVGEILDLGSGYGLQAKRIDIDRKEVWLEFDKDGQFIADKIISLARDDT